VGIHKIALTKLDEAVSFGMLINVIRHLGKQLSFVTTGQEVPDQIEPGRADRLAELVLGGTLLMRTMSHRCDERLRRAWLIRRHNFEIWCEAPSTLHLPGGNGRDRSCSSAAQRADRSGELQAGAHAIGGRPRISAAGPNRFPGPSNWPRPSPSPPARAASAKATWR